MSTRGLFGGSTSGPVSVLVVVVVLLLCSNVLPAVHGQRGGSGSRLSTSVRSGKPRWVPRSITTESPVLNANNASAISANNQSVERGDSKEVEEDVLPPPSTTKSVLEVLPAPTTTPTPRIEDVSVSNTGSGSSTTETPPRDLVFVKNSKTSKEDDVEAEDRDVEKPQIVRAANIKEATEDESKELLLQEKVPAKRDLPFVIQSSPGMCVLPTLSDTYALRPWRVDNTVPRGSWPIKRAPSRWSRPPPPSLIAS